MEVCITSLQQWNEFLNEPLTDCDIFIKLSGERKIRDLSIFLPYCSNIVDLDLSFTGLRTLEHINLFVNLKCLNVSRTNLLDPELYYLYYLNLEELYLSGNNIFDTHFLKNLTCLKKLSLSCTCIHNLSNLCHLQNLVYLDLYFTNVENLSPLYQLKNLYEIDIRRCPLSTCDIRDCRPDIKLIA